MTGNRRKDSDTLVALVARRNPLFQSLFTAYHPGVTKALA